VHKRKSALLKGGVFVFGSSSHYASSAARIRGLSSARKGAEFLRSMPSTSRERDFEGGGWVEKKRTSAGVANRLRGAARVDRVLRSMLEKFDKTHGSRPRGNGKESLGRGECSS